MLVAIYIYIYMSLQVPHPLYRPKKLVPCADPLCDALHKDLGTTKDCREEPDQCHYQINYADGTTSLGVLLLDKFSLPTGSARNIAFGYVCNGMHGHYILFALLTEYVHDSL